jgi:hypothetical protein
MIPGNDWRDWWPIIYAAVLLNQLNPEKYPLHKNFWGYYRLFRRIPHEPFPERILHAGPAPRLKAVNEAVGFSHGNLESWLRRRVAYIQGINPDAH